MVNAAWPTAKSTRFASSTAAEYVQIRRRIKVPVLSLVSVGGGGY